MKQTKKKKNGTQKQAVSELTKEKAWKDFAESLPAGMQRLGAYALTAWEKNNPKRMEQYIRQMQALEGTQELFALYLLLMLCYQDENKFAGQWAEKTLLLEEKFPVGDQDRSDLLKRLSFAPVSVQKFIKDGHEARMRLLRLDMAMYSCEEGRFEKACVLFEAESPFREDEVVCYSAYLTALRMLERFEEGMAVTEQILSRFGGQSDEAGAGEKERASVAPAEVAAVITALLFRIKGLERGDASLPDAHEAMDGEARKLAAYLQELPADQKDRQLILTAVDSIQGRLEEAEEENGYLNPYRIIFKGIRKARFFWGDLKVQERCEENLLDLDIVDCDRDRRLNGFLRMVFLSIAEARDELEHTVKDTGKASYYRWLIACSKWHACRFQTEGEENREELQRTLKLIWENYPYVWKWIQEDADDLSDGDPADRLREMNADLGEWKRRNVDQTASPESLEKSYQDLLKEYTGK